jgi:uncharacterized coiled-coil DUF342 family protein
MKKLNSLDALSQLLDLKSGDESLDISNLKEIQKKLVTLRSELTKINNQRDILNKQINNLVTLRRNIQNKARRVLKSTLPSKSSSESEKVVKFKKPVKKKKK